MSGITLVILIFTPPIMALTASFIYWRTLSHPFLFFITAMLSMVGLQALIEPIVFSLLLPNIDHVQLAATDDIFSRPYIISTGGQIIFGLASLRWLSLGLRRPGTPPHF